MRLDQPITHRNDDLLVGGKIAVTSPAAKFTHTFHRCCAMSVNLNLTAQKAQPSNLSLTIRCSALDRFNRRYRKLNLFQALQCCGLCIPDPLRQAYQRITVWLMGFDGFRCLVLRSLYQ
ncbi:hypothetical protein OH492_20195 [Vibrio chagasii]|nr:hypothetical protein [Vibrio chagasii]